MKYFLSNADTHEVKFSEPMQTASLKIPDKDGNFLPVVCTAQAGSNSMIWSATITNMQLADHRYDSEEGREIYIDGTDLAGNRIDRDPSSIAQRTGKAWVSGSGGYQPGEDRNHKIRIDTKHDEKAIPALKELPK